MKMSRNCTICFQKLFKSRNTEICKLLQNVRKIAPNGGKLIVQEKKKHDQMASNDIADWKWGKTFIVEDTYPSQPIPSPPS